MSDPPAAVKRFFEDVEPMVGMQYETDLALPVLRTEPMQADIPDYGARVAPLQRQEEQSPSCSLVGCCARCASTSRSSARDRGSP